MARRSNQDGKEDDFDTDTSKRLTTTGWAVGVISLSVLAMLGIVAGFAMGAASRTNVATTTPKKTDEIAQVTPTTKPVDQAQPTTPATKPTTPTEPKKTEPKKTEPPKKDPPKVDPPKKEEPKKVDPPKKEVLFAKEILPIFQDKCVECHQPGLAKGGLDLKTLAALEKGGNTGKAVVGGNLAKSLLWKTIEDGEMPPAGKKQLTMAEKNLIKAWIESGAK